EAAQVGAEQQHPAPLVDPRRERVQAGGVDPEPRLLAVEQEQPVEDGRGEGVHVARAVEQPRRPAQRAAEEGDRGTPLGTAPEQEVQGDRIQQQARERTSAVARDRAQQPQGQAAAAFGPLLPVHAHGVASAAAATSPLATTRSPCSTRKRQRAAGAAASGSSSIRAGSPGSSGWTNLACGIARAGSGPASRSIASSTRSSTTTPGTTGWPGKWPGRAGWSCPI